MNEVYLGSEEDQQYIRTYLSSIRQLDPIEITTIPNPIRLTDPLAEQLVDIPWLWEMVSRCLEACERRYAVRISQLEACRYYTGISPQDDDVGGFYSPYSLGYQYWYEATFVVVLNPKLTSMQLRTIELARNFLHDCFHHSTFRSFRRAVRLPASSTKVAKHRLPEVYREQYGINFRDQDQNSYSSPGLTAKAPETINLNLLMDGVIVLLVADLLKECLGSTLRAGDYLEGEIGKEIFLDPFDESLLPSAHEFHQTVIIPTKAFVEYWDGSRFIAMILEAMVDGCLERLKCYFKEKTGVPDAWEKKFKKPGFRLPLNPNV